MSDHQHFHHDHAAHLAARGSQTQRAAMASIALALFLLGLKTWATWRTGSMAMLGSLADTGLDLFASLITLAGVSYATRPADDDHRFGHGKAEALAAMIQVVIVTISALAIAWRAIDRLRSNAVTAEADLGIGVSLVAIAATLALLAYQRVVIRRTGSVAIKTDNLHYQSDLLLNGAVIAALVLDQYLGLRWADPVFGIIIAGWLLYGAWHAAVDVLSHLMDQEWPAERKARFIEIATAHPEARGVHALRTRTSGTHDFAQFHLWLRPDMTINEAHDVMDIIEQSLLREFPGTDILIHPDPEGHEDRIDYVPSEMMMQGQ